LGFLNTPNGHTGAHPNTGLRPPDARRPAPRQASCPLPVDSV